MPSNASPRAPAIWWHAQRSPPAISATGVEAAEQALDEDAYDEESLRLVMAALAAQGRSSSALALYERMRLRLADELGTSPSELTDAAHVAVLKGLPVPGILVASPQSRSSRTFWSYRSARTRRGVARRSTARSCERRRGRRWQW